MHELTALLSRAIVRRRALITRLNAEGTDCYRLLHGIAEGAPGITVDRYGPLLLVQTFRAPLAAGDVDALQRTAAAELGSDLGSDLAIVCNHRGAPSPAGHGESGEHVPTAAAAGEHLARERGARFVVSGRHRGQDPWLFLDLRPARARVQHEFAGKRVLNLFAYTCGVGIAAALGGAAFVCNVDFAASALAVGARNAALNGIDAARCVQLQADCLPILRQLAGLPVQRRGKHVPFVTIAREPFDLVVLDPPRLAKSPFGTVDVANDYQSLFKPALLSLTPGGAVLATNHVPGIAAADWHAQLRRCADKCGRPLRSLEAIALDDDFPSFDGQPPQKFVLARI
jgi:23S rRNA (cytosine1962-C5)-methyltransferase